VFLKHPAIAGCLFIIYKGGANMANSHITVDFKDMEIVTEFLDTLNNMMADERLDKEAIKEHAVPMVNKLSTDN